MEKFTFVMTAVILPSVYLLTSFLTIFRTIYSVSYWYLKAAILRNDFSWLFLNICAILGRTRILVKSTFFHSCKLSKLMPVVKDSFFVEAVWNKIFEKVKNCLFFCYYNKSNLTKLKNPILFRLNFFADFKFSIIHQGTKLLLITGVTVILIRKTRH